MPYSDSVKRLRDFYSFKKDAPIYQREFGYFTLNRWSEEGHIKKQEEFDDYWKYVEYLDKLFEFDDNSFNKLGGLGWCEAGFAPTFEEKILEDRGEHELAQDFAGRTILYFKGEKNGYMPEYVDHPVKDWKTWEEDVKWRMNPHTEGRIDSARAELEAAKVDDGKIVQQCCVGGYMYLRSLIGPEDLMYKFYDEPDLIHDCMKTWFELADYVIGQYQKEVAIDELFLAEDICYNAGSLISPDMIKEFLFPYYQQLYTNMKRRNKDDRTLHFQIDTDGHCHDVIDLYKSIGVDALSPFEVAAGCDVVELGKQHPDLLMTGGIDKRIIALGGDDIKRHLDYIMPAMRKRGGYYPTCDHGVPAEVSFENYMLYRSLMKEYCK